MFDFSQKYVAMALLEVPWTS